MMRCLLDDVAGDHDQRTRSDVVDRHQPTQSGISLSHMVSHVIVVIIPACRYQARCYAISTWRQATYQG